MKNYIRTIAFILCCTLMLQMLPIRAGAVDTSTKEIVNPDLIPISTQEEAAPYVVNEVTELRKESQKHFRLSDGNYLAVSYGDTVHYLESDGTWADINNTLTVSKDGRTYSARNGGETRYFASELNDSGYLLTAESGEYQLSLSAVLDPIVNPGLSKPEDTWESREVSDETTDVESMPEVTEEENEGREEMLSESIGEELAETFVEESSEGISEEAMETTTEEQETGVTEQESTEQENINPTERVEEESTNVPSTEATVSPEEILEESAGLAVSEAFTDATATLRSTAVVINPGEDFTTLSVAEKKDLTLKQQTAPVKLSSSVIYEAVWQNTDLDYSINGNHIKECIVVNAPCAEYIYRFRLNLTELTPVLNDDGSISLFADSGEIIFTLPAPYMTDEEGAYSDAVSYSVMQETNGEYLLTVTADKNWINDSSRVFPVKIDPTIYKEGNAQNEYIYSTYVNSGSTEIPSPNHTKLIRCGYYNNTTYDANCIGSTIGLIYINDLPDLPAGSVSVEALLNLFQVSYGGSITTQPTIYTSQINGSYTDIQSYLDSMTWRIFSSDISYGNPNSLGEKTVVDYVKANGEVFGEKYWDITSAVQQWYSNPNDKNRLLVLDDGNRGTTNARATYGGYCYDTVYNLPQIVVCYKNVVGTEEIYDYHTQSAGRAGVGHVNNFTLGMTLSVPLVSAPSETLPFSLSLIYNSPLSGSNFTNAGDVHTKNYTTSQSGFGWKTSVQQSIVPLTVTGNNSSTATYLVYTDADGTEHYFHKKSSTVYEDEDGLDLTITASSSGTNPTRYTMKDKEGNTWLFYYGFLTQFTDYNGNNLYYAYNGTDYSSGSTSWQPSSGTTTANRVTSVWRKNNGENISAEKIVALSYSGDYLSFVTDQAGRKTTIEILNNKLQSITFPDNQKATYHYEDVSDLEDETKVKYLLTSAKDQEAGYGISYTYTNVLGEERVYLIQESARIEAVAGDTETWITGETMRAYKQGSNYTRFRYYGADRKAYPEVSNSTDDIVSRFWFDNYGRTVNVANYNYNETEIFGVSAATYMQNEGTSKTNNRLTGAGSSGLQSNNLLYNSGLEYTTTVMDGWLKSGSGNSAVKDSSETSTNVVYPRSGNKLLKMYLASTSAGTASAYQTVYLKANTTYVFSAYVNTVCTTAISATGGAYLSFRNTSNSDIASSRSVNYNTERSIENGWERLEVVYRTGSQGGAFQVAANIKNMTSITVFDDFQLEEVVQTQKEAQADGAASTVNLLQMGSFELWTSATAADRTKVPNWWTYDSTKVSPGLYTGRGYVMSFAPYTSRKHRASQTVNLNVPSNTTYILSAWGLAPAANMNTGEDLTGDNSGNERFFGMIATITYKGIAEPEYHYVPFNDDVSDWQYVSGIIVPKKENETVASITVTLASDFNGNRVYMDDISLIQEPVQTYTYDDEGNPITLSDSENNKTEKEYDSSDRLVEYTGMDGITYALTYSGTNRDPATITGAGLKTSYSYDTAGNVTQTTVRSSSTSDTTPSLQSSATYSEDKDQVVTATDVNGAKVQYVYYSTGSLATGEKATDLLKSVIAPNNVVTRYSYFTENDRSSTVTVDNTNVIAYEYARGVVTGLSRRNSATETTWQRYKTTYNAFGQKTSVAVEKVGNDNGRPAEDALSSITLATYTYAENGGNLTQMTYGNGAYVKYTYDILDRPVKEVYYTSSNTITKQILYVYNAQGALGKKYTLNGSGTVTEKHVFTYDSLGRLIYSTEYDGNDNVIQRIHQTYDKSNRLSAQSWTVGTTPYSESYTYNDPGVSGSTGDGTLQKMTISTGNSITFSYDSLKRLAGASSWNGSNRFLSTFYSYKTRTDDSQNTYSTTRVNQRNVYYGSNLTTENIIFGEQFEYDASGNIIAVYERRKNTSLRQLASYDYDNLNQLTQEIVYTYDSDSDTTPTTTTYLYTYDSGGNIKKIEKNNTVIKSFTYGNSTWRDQLTKVGTLNLTYDAIGNPTTYGNGDRLYTNLTWQNGRQLTALTTGSKNYTYAYDAEGIRTSKVVDGVTHTYITQNGKVIRETIGTGSTAKVLDFIYDNNGRPFSLIYTNGTAQPVTYYYVLNYQGDVVNLVTAAGSPAATYRYNAWGEILKVTDANGTAITNTADIAHINPIRYRGYYYDSETGFYYLQSRYYDPANHRFINADSYVATGQGFLGTNMFAYCGNCPCSRLDVNGEGWETIWDIISFCASVGDVWNDPSDEWAWFCLVGDFADIAIPFLGGGGEAIRAYSLANKARDTIEVLVDGYGNLSRASEFGIKAYKKLRKALEGTGLHAHHIIEQRLVKHLGIDVTTMLSVAVTTSEHQVFTNAWRAIFKYGMDYSKLTVQDLWEAAQQVYKDYPELLKAAKTILFGDD